MDAEWPPESPKGYRLHDPEYEQPWYVTLFLFIWIVGMFAGVPVLVIGAHGLAMAGTVLQQFASESLKEWLIYAGWVGTTLGVTACFHEIFHALAGRWFGLEYDFTLQYENLLTARPEVLTYGEFQSISESIAISLLPLMVLTPASLFILVAGQSALALLKSSESCRFDR